MGRTPRSRSRLRLPLRLRSEVERACAIGARALRPLGRLLQRVSPTRLVVIASTILVLGLVGFVAELLARSYRDAINEAEHRTQDFVDLLAEHTALTFDNASRTIDVAIQSRAKLILEGAWWPVPSEEPYQMLRALLKSSSALMQLAVVDQNGDRLYTGLRLFPPPTNVATRRHFVVQRERSDVGLFVGPPSLSDITGHYGIPISRRLETEQGEFAGIITGLIEPAYFANTYETTTRRQRLVIQLALLDGTVLLRMPSVMDMTGTSAIGTNLFDVYLKKSPEGTFSGVYRGDGVDRIVSYKTIGKLPLVISVAMAKTDALAVWRQTVAIALAFFTPLLVALVVGSWLLVLQLRQRARRQREEEEAKERLREAQKLQALGTLTGGIAHEINNALVPIMTLAEMAEEALPEGSFERDSVGQIRQSANQIESLIKRILTFSRGEQASSAPLDLEAFVGRLLESLRGTLPKNIALVDEIEPGIGAVNAGEEKLTQVFTDLVSNAAHAIGAEPGRIAISAHADPAPAAASRANAGRPVDYVRLSVTDDGPGILPIVRERLFEPFFTTKEAGAGVGLGLYTARRVVAELGGHLDVESEPGKGACFSIYLPRAAARGEHLQPA